MFTLLSPALLGSNPASWFDGREDGVFVQIIKNSQKVEGR